MKRFLLIMGLGLVIILIFVQQAWPHLKPWVTEIRSQVTLQRIIDLDDDHASEVLHHSFINPNLTNAAKDSILIWAVSRNMQKTAAQLLVLGADPNLPDAQGITPLMYAVSRNAQRTAENLVKYGADPHALDFNDRNALFYAVQGSRTDSLTWLIDLGVEINQHDSRGTTPLHSAVEWHSKAAIRVLLVRGADLMSLDHQGQSPLTLMEYSPLYSEYLRIQEIRDYLPSRYVETLPVEDLSTEQEPTWNLRELQRMIHQKVNLKREQHGLTPYRYDEELERLAVAHSVDMSIKNYFAHINQEGESPTQRAIRLGIQVEVHKGLTIQRGIAENLFMCSLKRSTAYYLEDGMKKQTIDWHTVESITNAIVDGWMNSPGHRENLLATHLENQGLGLMVSKEGNFYASQEMR